MQEITMYLHVYVKYNIIHHWYFSTAIQTYETIVEIVLVSNFMYEKSRLK